MEIKYKSYNVTNTSFNYVEIVNGIEVNKSIPLFVDNIFNPQAYSIYKEIERVREELKSENYHPHLDFYNSLTNPLDSYETLSILVNSYANSLKDGSMYYTLTHANTGKKQFKGKIDTLGKDVFYAKLFNMWKNNIIKLDDEGRFSDSPNYKNLASKLRDINDIRTYKEYLGMLRDNFICKSIFTSMCLFTDWQHISSEAVLVGTNKVFHKIDHRFYINVEGVALYKLFNLLLNKCLERKLPFYIKFNEDCARDDTVVLYSDTSHFMKYLMLFEDIKKEYPDIVKYVENPPILTSKFCDYIGYGSEPSIEENEKKYSFNQLREKIINNAFDITIDNWIEDNIDKGISYNDKQISTIDLISEVCADQIYGYYKDLFIRYKLNNQLNLFRTNYGLTSLDFESSELRLRIYERIKKHVKDIVSDPSYISTHEDELSIEVHDGKVISITDSKFLSAKKGIVRFIFNDDHTLMQELKNNINKLAKFEGVDTFNFAFDDRIKSKFELQDKYLRRRQKLEKEDQIYETKQLSA